MTHHRGAVAQQQAAHSPVSLRARQMQGVVSQVSFRVLHAASLRSDAGSATDQQTACTGMFWARAGAKDRRSGLRRKRQKPTTGALAVMRAWAMPSSPLKAAQCRAVSPLLCSPSKLR